MSGDEIGDALWRLWRTGWPQIVLLFAAFVLLMAGGNILMRPEEPRMTEVESHAWLRRFGECIRLAEWSPELDVDCRLLATKYVDELKSECIQRVGEP